jgi:three-Cys-motif partner protein
MTALDRHHFGGAWTEKKLRIMTAYLGFFTKVMSGPFKFETWYIDAFAGTGLRTASVQGGGLFESRPIEEFEQSFEGSARLSLRVEPPFTRYLLIEAKPAHVLALKMLQSEFPGRDLQCIEGEANQQLRELFTSRPWTGPGNGKRRALVFLDPYGLSVDWTTLEVLAGTSAVDVWYFFNLEGVTRQCAHNPEKMDAAKIARLNAVFGSSEWRTEFYNGTAGLDLFSQQSDRRSASKEAISAYATRRLGELFDYVSPPIPLLVEGRGHAFSLYCMSNNKNAGAQSAIKRGVAQVTKLLDLKQPMPAFHQTSVP